MNPITTPLRFRPVYHTLVWGGRRMEQYRRDLPPGPIGESWDLADHPRGMSVVADGPLAGRSLRELMQDAGRDLVGAAWDGGEFPLLVKLIDALDRLSIQVHPDDALAQKLRVGPRGKTECWRFMADGGELFVGLKPGVRREDLARALTGGGVADCLNRFEARAGDFFFIPARTIHALGQGCLIYEVQQTCDVTFRVHDWDRLGLDGKPRALHVTESLETIDFDAPPATVIRHLDQPHPAGGEYRPLVTCPYFHVEERSGLRFTGDTEGRPVILTGLSGQGTISTRDGSTDIAPWQTVVIPAAAGPWNANTQGEPLRVLCATTVNQG